MVYELMKRVWRGRKKERRWLSQRIYDSRPVLGRLKREVKRVQKERRTPAPTAPSAIRVIWLLPSFLLYLSSVFMAGAFVWGLHSLCGPKADDILNASIPIQWTVTILALAVPVVSTYSGIRSADEFAISYLWSVTKIARFAECAGAAVFANMFAWMMGLGVAEASTLGWVVLVIFRVTALGLTIATVLALVGVLLEVILVASRPEFAVTAGARFHALGLVEGMLRQWYVDIFGAAHGAELDKAVEQVAGLRGPSHAFGLYVRPDKAQSFIAPWLVTDAADLATQFVDYDVRRLVKFGEGLPDGVEVYLHRHGRWLVKPQDRLELGQIVSDAPLQGVRIPKVGHVAKARPHRCLEWTKEERNAWEDLYRRRVNDVLSRYDQTSFSVLVRTMREAWERLAAIEPEAQVESFLEWQFGRFHVQLLDQLLRFEPQAGVLQSGQLYEFASILQDDFRRGVEGCVRALHMATFKLYMSQMPDLYERLCDWCDKNSEDPGVRFIHRIRALWGRNLRLFDSLVAELPPSASAQDKGAFLYALHRNCVDWARKATSRKDTDCVATLGEVLAQAYKAAQQWEQELATVKVHGMSYSDMMLLRHLALLGEAIQEQHALTKPLLGKEIRISGVRALKVLSQTRTTGLASTLDDFGHRGDFPITSSDPLLGSASGSGFLGALEKQKLMLGAVLCLVVDWESSGGDWAVEPIGVSIEEVKSALATVCEHSSVLTDADVYLSKDYGKELLAWVQECNGAADEETKKDIVEAQFDPARIEEFKERFWKAFKDSLTLVGHLIEQKAFVRDEGALTGPSWARTTKREFIEPFGDISYGSSGDQFGRLYSRSLNERFVKELAEAVPSDATHQRETSGDLSRCLNAAVDWLRIQNCDGNSGIILVPKRFYLEIELRDDKMFLPQWRDPQSVAGFTGRYRNFLIRSHALSGREDCLLALSLVGWRPLKVQGTVLEDTKWGAVSIRDFEPQELENIKTAYEKQQKTFSELDCRQDVVVEVNLFAQFDLTEAKRSARSFSIIAPP